MAFDVEGAIKAGYSRADIADYLASQQNFDIAGARKAGYDDQDIIQHLSAAPAPAPAAKPTTEAAPLEEAGKGARSGVSALKSMWEGLGASKDANVALGYAQRLSVYDQIDRGILNKSNLTPDKVGGDMSPQFRDAQIYLASDEGKRQQLRNRAADEIKNRKELFDTAVKTIQQYQEENKKNKGRTENLTDIEGAKDFANWLSFNLGSGAVQLAPVMTAAVLTGGPGAFAVGTGMELGGQSLNRLEFILNKTKAEKDPQKRAEEVLKYVQKTNDTNLMAAIAAGAVDVLLGPVADVIKQPITQAVKERTRKEIAKQAAKAVPRQTAEEGLAGGTQETISIMAERALEEQGGPAFTKENIKRVVNAAAAEAVGGGGASVTLGGIRTAVGPTAEAPEAAPTVEPTVEPEAPAAPAAPPTDPRKEALVKSYIDQGFMPDDADLLATQALGGLEPTPPAAPTPTVAPAVAEEVSAFLPRELAGAKPRYAFGNKLFELNFESDIDRAAYIAAQGTPSKRDADYVNFVARATGMSEPEVRAHGRAVRDSIKAQARASETGGRLEVAEVARARKPVAPPAAPAGVPPLELPITDAEGRAIQRQSAEDEARTMAGRAERAALQMEGDNVPTTEPPPFVTEPSTDERGIPVPSAEAGAAELPTTPIDRGLGAASSAARQLAGREELERTALVEQQELAERAISRGFAREPYPDLGLTLGASWVRDTLATNPTPEQYQEAAYARLEELGGLPPRDARPAFERRAPAAPMVGERPEERVEPAAEAAPTEAVEAPAVPKAVQPVKTVEELEAEREALKKQVEPIARANAIAARDDSLGLADTNEYLQNVFDTLDEEGITDPRAADYAERAFNRILKEEPRGPEAPKAVKAKEERPAQPTEAAAPLELEAARRPELEVEPEEEIALKNIDEFMKAVYGTTAAGELRKRGAGAGRPETGAAKTIEQRRAEEKAQNQFNRDIATAIKAAGKYTERQELASFKTKEEWEAAEEVRVNNLNTIRGAIYGASRQPGASKGVIAAKDYIRGLKEAERKAAEKAHEEFRAAGLKTAYRQPMEARRKKGSEYLAEQQLAMEPDLGFYDVDTIAGALVQIAQSPNELEATLAARLLQRDNAPTLRNVNFVVVDRDTKLKDKTAKQMLNKGTVGMFSPTTVGGTVYVRGDSYENQGINNEIVLHEAMHVAGSKKIDFVLAARSNDMEVEANLVEAVNALEDLMVRAKTAYDSKKSVNTELKFAAEADAFTDIQEFYAYGMTNAAMKQFLLNEVKGVSEKKSGFDIFIDALLKLFGIDPKLKSGLKDLVLISHEIMKAEQPSRAQLEEAFIKDNNKVFLEAREKNKTTQKAEEKLKAAASATEVVEQMGSLMKVAKDPTLWVDYLRVNYRNIATPAYKGYLAALPVNVLVDLAEAMGIGNVKQLNAGVQKMHTFRTKTLNKVQELAVPWIKLNANEQKKLADVMHMATDLQIDPAKNKSNAALYMRYNALTPEAKAIYTKVRDFYRGNYDLYRALLAKRVADTPINNVDRQSLMNAIKETYEVGAKIEPYFPLMRYGEYWVSFGKGVNKEFYMFESPGERDLFRDRRAAELKRRDPNIEIEAGNDIEGMRKNLQGDSANLKALFGLVDSMQVTDPKLKDTLKNEIFQLHLLTLPEASFRKQFIKRKGTAGFSGDALRNFITSGTRFANQIARIKYGPEIRNSLAAAEASLEGDPDRPKKSMVTNELGLRVKDELEPDFRDTALEKIARTVNKAAFVWLLTSVHSAANQLFSVVNFTLPTLAKYHGWGPATAQLMQTVATMYTQVGTTSLDKDGNVTYTAPTMMNNRSLRLSPIEQRAYQAMLDRGIADATRTQDLFLRKGQPSATYNDKTAKIVNALGALFHTTESLSREVTFMAAFRLNIRKMPFEDAVENAIHTVNESLFDYSPWNAPRILKSAPARVVTQFMKFPLFVSLYLARNARAIFKPMDGETRTGAAKAFFGTLGLTGVLAGVSGLPMFSTLMGIAQGLRNLMEDDDEEVVLEEENLMRWFRNVWLPETFGETTVMGMNLAELIDSGVLNAATGYDFAGGISLNNMWFRDAPEASNWKDAYASTINSLLGPGVGLGESWASAIDDINKGDTLKGFEKLTPALFRGTLTAARYKTEGAMDAALRPIKEADEFTNAQLMMQAMGFKTTGLAKVMEDNFAIRQMQQKILQKRTSLISNLDRAATMDREADFEKVMDQIDEYNAKYPSPDLRIDYEDIKRAMERRRKAMQTTERGMIQDPRFRDLEVLRERGLELIEKEAAE